MSEKGLKEQKNKNKRTIRILYGDEVTVLPLAAADAAERASGLDCKILWCLSADPAAREGSPEALLAFSERIGVSLGDVERAIAYWRGAGVLDLAERSPSAAKKAVRREAVRVPEQESAVNERGKTEGAKTAKKPRPEEALPNYTMTELSELLEKRRGLSLFIDECQRAYGRMFNPRDIGKIVGLIEHLGLSEEYVLTLLHYFGELPEEERKTLHYVEKMAFTLADDGVTDPLALREHLDRLSLLRTNEGQIRTIFGMGARALTAKEKKAVMLWLGEYRASMDLIRLAYEKTVNATGKASVPYADKILERWYREGLSTPEEIERSERDDKAERSDGGSFSTDDFFEAALRRSYGETYEQLYGDKEKLEQ